MKQFFIFLLLTTFFLPEILAQFNVRGDAVATTAVCAAITPNQTNREGAVWSQTPLDFNQPFELYNRVSFGTRNGNGADGIALVFQISGPLTNPSPLGGGSLSYAGMIPSLAIEMDTWSNGGSNDPGPDHLAIMRDGINDHNTANNLAGPVPIMPGSANIEDGNFHDVKVSWDPGTQLLQVFIDCGPVSLSYTGDIVNTIFGGTNLVTWGFTAATGSAGRNAHNMCFEDLIIPVRDTLFLCEGNPVPLAASPGVSFSWTPTTGLSDPNIQNPIANPSTTTTYVATVTDNCGLTFTDTIRVEVTPAAELQLDLGADTTLCPGQSILLDAYRPGPTYLWQDGLTDSARVLSVGGLYWVELTNGCGSNRDSIVVTSEVNPLVDFGNDTTLCGTATLNLDATNSNASYQWQDASTFPQFQVTMPGVYWATATNFCGTDTDSISVDYQPIPPTDLFNATDTTLCGTATLDLDVSLQGATYLWQDNSTLPTFSISSSGLYWVEVSNACGTVRDSINVNYDLRPDIFLGNDTTLCTGTTRVLDASWTPASTYQWQDGSTNSTFQVNNSGEYWVRVSNFCGTDIDTVEINFVDPPPVINLGNDTTLCQGDTLDLATNATGIDHLWQDGSTLTSYRVLSSGTYWVAVSNSCGVNADTIEATFNPLPQIFLGNDTLLCEGETITLDATWPGATYIWDDGFIGPVRTITQPAGYVVSVSNACGAVDAGIVVDFQAVPQPFDFGQDVTLCAGDTLLLESTQAGFEYFWQDGSDEMSFVVRSPGAYSLQVFNDCAIETDEIFVAYQDLPVVDLGADQLLCEEDLGQLRLEVKPSPGQTYLWQDGSSDPFYLVQQGGLITLEVSNNCGVSADSVVVFTEICNCIVNVPSAFSPNFDGVNDLFKAETFCNLQEARLKIFDRWGVLVFETDNPDQAWDGSCNNGLCMEGVYVWVYEYVFPDRNNEPVRTQKSGTLTLIK
ncbi:MAG: gliding motility-associated C-terminal domain-containing protein [Bacteroidia bacterium]|nr:gliding motility-associated C-terminal domain-containing protein [Bacteroidia bacterium]